jgi:hypothetical protein
MAEIIVAGVTPVFPHAAMRKSPIGARFLLVYEIRNQPTTIPPPLDFVCIILNETIRLKAQ